MMRRFRPFTLVVIAAVLLAACNLSEDRPGIDRPVIIVTATPSTLLASPVVPTVPYVTPPPAILPPAPLPPDIALREAEQALYNGDYETAVQKFQSVISQPASDAGMREAAMYGLGEAALREGRFDIAASALTEFISTFPTDTQIPRAYFLRGDAFLGLGEWQNAINDFNQYLEMRPGVIDSYAQERIGDAYLALNNPEQSLAAYARAADATRALAPLFELRERVAVGYLNAGQPDQAIAQYDAILAEAQNGGYIAGIQLQAAQVLIDQGDAANGYRRLETLVNDYPSTYSAYLAMGLMLDAGMSIDSYTQGIINYNNEDYAAAIEDFNDYSAQQGYAPVDVLMMLGRSYRALGNYQAAISTFQTVLDTYPEDPSFGDAWLEQGRTLFMSGDTNGAILTYTALAAEHPESGQAAEALWRAGYLYSSLNDVDNALATFDILGQTYPGSEWAQEGLFMGATMAYNSGNLSMATQLFSQLAQTGTGEQQAAAYLWVGRLYQQDGKDDLARQSYLAAAAADPGGYYSLRADDLLNNRAPFQAPATVTFDFDDAAQQTEAENWLRTTFGITQQGSLSTLSTTLQADPRLIRGTELMAVAHYEEAELEFDALREELVEDPLATYQLAIYLRDLRLYRLSITAAATLIDSANIDTSLAPKYLARLRYPIYYSDLVLPNAELNNLDPLLVFSLIRQESLFEGFATSYAAAQGLMQIIPSTGLDIAQRLSWPNYQNSDVYRPYINVTFGTYYLRYVLDLVDNQPYAALAGYNGGPGNAMTWLEISGPDLDLFVQTVEFDETRTYVRRIYEQYDAYRAIYGE